MQYKIPFIDAYKNVAKPLMEQCGCTCIQGHGSLKDAHTIVVDGKEYIHGSRDMLSIAGKSGNVL